MTAVKACVCERRNLYKALTEKHVITMAKYVN